MKLCIEFWLFELFFKFDEYYHVKEYDMLNQCQISYIIKKLVTRARFIITEIFILKYPIINVVTNLP